MIFLNNRKNRPINYSDFFYFKPNKLQINFKVQFHQKVWIKFPSKNKVQILSVRRITKCRLTLKRRGAGGPTGGIVLPLKIYPESRDLGLLRPGCVQIRNDLH